MGNGPFLLPDSDESGRAPVKLKLDDTPEGCIALVPTWIRRRSSNWQGRTGPFAVLCSPIPFGRQNYLYQYNVDRWDDEKVGDLGMKDLRLSRPNHFDNRTKEIWIGKKTSGVCLSIYPKASAITGTEDRRCWNRIPTDESRL
ncbi:hypothetical protein U1Q18_027177 [Sarracenia purpurea var. burkii]